MGVPHHQILLLLDASDVGSGELGQLDPCLTVVLDEVSSDIGAALLPSYLNAVVAALFQQVEPHHWSAGIGAEGRYFDTVLVLVLDSVVNNLGVIAAHLYPYLVLIKSVAYDLHGYQELPILTVAST